MGNVTISSPTFSTSTTRFISYFLIVFEIKFTVTLISLCGGIVPAAGTISNSLGGPVPWVMAGEPISLRTLSRSLVPQMESVTPSPGTRRWNDMGTSEVLVSVHVWVFRKPESDIVLSIYHWKTKANRIMQMQFVDQWERSNIFKLGQFIDAQIPSLPVPLPVLPAKTQISLGIRLVWSHLFYGLAINVPVKSSHYLWICVNSIRLDSNCKLNILPLAVRDEEVIWNWFIVK